MVSIILKKNLFSNHFFKATIMCNLVNHAGLAQSVVHLTEVAGSISGAGPILRNKYLQNNEGTSFSTQTAKPWRDSDDHIKWRSRL